MSDEISYIAEGATLVGAAHFQEEVHLTKLVPVEKDKMIEIIRRKYRWYSGELEYVKSSGAPSHVIHEYTGIFESIKQLAIELGVNYEVSDE